MGGIVAWLLPILSTLNEVNHRIVAMGTIQIYLANEHATNGWMWVRLT